MSLWDSGDGGDATWTVAELGEAISAGISRLFPAEIWLRGEIRSLRPPNRSGHQYFDLIEPGAAQGSYPDAKMSVNLFRTARARVDATLAAAPGGLGLVEGAEVRIRAKVDWWASGGQLRLVMSDIDPVFTLGQLDAQRRALLGALAAEGLLDANAKLALAPVPMRIGLVTSAGSAAHADFMDEIRASRYAFDVALIDARVQGAEAVPTLVAAIERLDTMADTMAVDVIVVVRGGGSRTDLVAFDHTDVAHAIARASVPVFTGIGHEIDRSVADEVAHSAFKTPTATAAALVQRVAEAEATLDRFTARLAAATSRRLTMAQNLLDGQVHRVARAATVAGTRAHTHLNGLTSRLGAAATARIRQAERHHNRQSERLIPMGPRQLGRSAERLDALEARLRASDPARLAARGWSLTRTAQGVLVRSTDQVSIGTELVTTLADGTVSSTVTTTQELTP